MKALIERQRKLSAAQLSVIGFGMGNYKDSKMQLMAEHGDGNYAYVDDLREAAKVLFGEFGATAWAAARDAKMQVEFNPATVASYRLIGYESRLLETKDFNDDRKDGGEIGAGHCVTALYELIPVGAEEHPAGSVDALRYQGRQGTPVVTIPSAEALAEGEEEPLQNWQLALTMLCAVGMAVLLFVVAPHGLSLLMQWLGLGGAVEGLSFHLWDGFFKCCIFMLYIRAISWVPDIRRVFQYHGAEHKTIHAFESGQTVDADFAARMSRLHPRCGTTFLLFVICISIVLHAVLVPLLLAYWSPEQAWLKHAGTLLFKIALIVPISALAYELIRFAARLDDGIAATILRAPGLALQRLTTEEPDEGQLEVAIVALYEALGPEDGARVLTVPHSLQDDVPRT